MYFVYVLQNDKKGYYVGCTSDPVERIKRHNQGRSRFTRRGKEWKLVYEEKHEGKKEALRRERFIKNQKSRKYIESLISRYSGVEQSGSSSVS